MFKSFKNLLGLVSLLVFFGVWIGCSSESSPVSPSASKALTDDDTATATTDDPLAIIPIPDDSLRAAIVRVVSPTSDGPITITRLDMESLTALDANHKGITNLTGLEYATDLKSLNLNRNNVADLAPLANLTKLEYLNLENNLIPQTGYSHLANLTKLTSLRIGGHRNADIGNPGIETLVARMPDLEGLKLNHMGLTDIAFLEKLTKLSYVNIRSNQITNFKPLVCLKNLVRMHVGNNPGVGNSAEGYDPFIQYLIDKGVTTYF